MPIKSYFRYACIIVLMTILACLGWIVDGQSIKKYFQKPSNLFYSLFEQLGNSSYSLSLTHSFTLVLASYVCMKLHFTSPFLFIASLLVSSVSCGFFVYRFIERPLSKWIRSKG